MMIKFKLVFLALVAASTIFATSAVARDNSLLIGFKGGVNSADFKGDVKDVDAKMGYQLGVTVDIEFTNNLYLQTGLEFIQKSLQYDSEKNEEMKIKPMYLQIPMHMAYKFDLARNVRLFVSAGPYLALGMAGKEKGEKKENIFRKDHFKRVDYGIGAGLGVEFGALVLGVGYDFGLANVSDMEGVKIKNKGAIASIGFKF